MPNTHVECRGGLVISWSSGTPPAMAPNLVQGKNFPEKSTFDTHNTPTTGANTQWEVTNLSWWVPSMERVDHLVGPPQYWAPNWVKQVHRLINGSETKLAVHATVPTTTPQVQVAP